MVKKRNDRPSVLLVVTIIVFLLNFILYSMGDWWGVIVIVFGPIEIFILLVLWLFHASRTTLFPKTQKVAIKKHRTTTQQNHTTRASAHNVQHSIPTRISRIGLYTSLVGILFILYFTMVGGPNKGDGRHIFGNNGNTYFDLQLGLTLILLGGIVAFTAHIAANRKLILKNIKRIVSIYLAGPVN